MKQIGFGNTFIQWIKIIFKDQASCLIKAGKTSQSFKLERRTKQEILFLAYLFILVLRFIFFALETKQDYQRCRVI